MAGWALGILALLGAMAAFSATLYAPKGFGFAPLHLLALLFVTPIPLAVIGFTLFTALRALGRMDAVAIVERGELSLERTKPGRARPERPPRPLAVTTFYRRHAGRAVTLVGAINQLAFMRRLPEFGTLHAVGAGAVSWALSRLDPVAVIERR